MMKYPCDHGDGRENGFTMLETIIAIVLLGILGAMTLQFMASALTDATLPITYVQAETGRISIMEKVISDYVIEVNKTTYATALTTMWTKADNGDYDDGDTAVTMSWIGFDGSGTEVGAGAGSDYLKVVVTTGGVTIVSVLGKSRTTATDPKVAF